MVDPIAGLFVALLLAALWWPVKHIPPSLPKGLEIIQRKGTGA